MNELERPHNLDVEKTFNQFVVEQGGQLVGESLSKIETLNADYSFENPNVIIELKCFQKDVFGDEDDVERIGLLIGKWVEKGFIKKEDEFKTALGIKELPLECKLELVEKAKKTIDRIIHKANKQIIETRKILNKPDAFGLLLLANDGNYFFQDAQFISVICDIMQKKYLNSGIDGFVYFTVNQTAYIPGSDLDWHVWVPAYGNDSDDTTLSDFVDNLGYQFHYVFLPKLRGVQPPKRISGRASEIADQLKHAKHIPKSIIYKKGKS